MDSGGLLRTRGRHSFGLRTLPSELRETSCVNGYIRGDYLSKFAFSLTFIRLGNNCKSDSVFIPHP
jgi:hypothetical protein